LQNFKIAKNGIIIVVDKLQTGFDEPKLHTLFLDKEIRGINAIQTISRVNRTAKYKNDCKIVDFSYKNINVKNIKEAFEHFSNVVVSDFDPLGDEEKLKEIYKELSAENIFKTHFSNFKAYKEGKAEVQTIVDLENDFDTFIRENEKDAKAIKSKILKYFKILNLIEFVIELDKKYSEEIYIEFWHKYNMIYNQINGFEKIIDDVEIYFDNRIGIVAPKDDKEKDNKTKNPTPTDNDKPNRFKYNILKVIEKRNQEEEEIEALIKDFEEKITQFFDYIKSDADGKRLIAKMTSTSSSFQTKKY
jgi:type I restriction enzyme R subunit